MRVALLGDELVFPDVAEALDEPNGLLAVGGDLSIERLCYAYQQGIFPWYNDGEPIIWWSPNPRNVLRPQDFHLSKSTRKTFRKQPWQYSINTAFNQVIEACANEREEGTWINKDMLAAYRDLHSAGFAHSIEIWQNDALIGGLYGVKIDRMFFGESMFSRQTNASKAALMALCKHCRADGVVLIDCQVESSHLASLGAQTISRDEFSGQLQQYAARILPSQWYADAVPLSSLLAAEQHN